VRMGWLRSLGLMGLRVLSATFLGQARLLLALLPVVRKLGTQGLSDICGWVARVRQFASLTCAPLGRSPF
jgi:hypothetical protein